jgi:hypothetical protein
VCRESELTRLRDEHLDLTVLDEQDDVAVGDEPPAALTRTRTFVAGTGIA